MVHGSTINRLWVLPPSSVVGQLVGVEFVCIIGHDGFGRAR